MTEKDVEHLPVTVPIDASYGDIVGAFKRVWAMADIKAIGNVYLSIEDRRPDLALRIMASFDDSGPASLVTLSLSGRSVTRAPQATAEQQTRQLVEMLELMGWREPGSIPPEPRDPARLDNFRRLAEKARNLEPAQWPGWSTSEWILASLAADRPDMLPKTYRDPEDAWLRLDNDQRAVVEEINPEMAQRCRDSVETNR